MGDDRSRRLRQDASHHQRDRSPPASAMTRPDPGHQQAAGHSEAAGHKQAGHSGRQNKVEAEVKAQPDPKPEPRAMVAVDEAAVHKASGHKPSQPHSQGDAPQPVAVAQPAGARPVMPETAPQQHDQPVAQRAAPSPKHSAPDRSTPKDAAVPAQRSGWEDIEEVEEEDAAAFLARTEVPASATSSSRTSSPPGKIPHVPIGVSSPPEKMHTVPAPAERVDTSPVASARRTTTAGPRARPRKDSKIEF